MLKTQITRWLSLIRNNFGIIHSFHTAIAAAISLAVSNMIGMPEGYWAPITTIIVMQSTLGASWAVSKERFIGTILGALLGGLVATFFTTNILIYGISIFVLGLVSVILRLNLIAYRFSGVTFSIITLVTRSEAAWLMGFHRFVEVSIGIAVALAMAAIWSRPKIPDPAT